MMFISAKKTWFTLIGAALFFSWFCYTGTVCAQDSNETPERGTQMTADIAFTGAVALMNSGEYELAQIGLQNFIKKYPENSQISHAKLYLGACFLNQGKYEEAEKILEPLLALRKFPRDQVLNRLGLAYYLHAQTLLTELEKTNSGRVPVSSPYNSIQKNEKQNPSSQVVPLSPHGSTVVIHAMPKKTAVHKNSPAGILYTKAQECFQNLIHEYPSSKLVPETRFYLGRILCNLGFYNNALQEFNEVLVRYPSHTLAPQAIYQRVAIYQNIGDFQKALTYADDLLKMLNSFPEDKRNTPDIKNLYMDAQMIHAEIQVSLGNYDRAEKEFSVLASLPHYPNREWAMLCRGDALLARKSYQEAASVYEQLVKKIPESPYKAQAQLSCGISYLHLKNEEKAVYYLEQALRDSATLRSAAVGLAQHYLLKKDASGTLKVLEQVTGLKETASDIIMRYHQKKQNEPQAPCSQAEQKYWENRMFATELLKNYAEALVIQNRDADAIPLYRDVAGKYAEKKDYNSTAQTLYSVARLQQKLQLYKEALTTISLIIKWGGFKNLPETQSVLYRQCYAQLLFQNELYIQSRDILDNLLKQYPSRPEASGWFLLRERNLLQENNYVQIIRDLSGRFQKMDTALANLESGHILSRAYFELKQYAEAYKVMHKTMKIYFSEGKDYYDTYRLFYDAANLQYSRKRYKDSLTIIDRALTIFPESSFQDQYYHLKGKVYVEQEDFTQARDAFMKVINLNPHSILRPHALLSAAQCELKLSHPLQAENLAKQLETEYPGTSAASQALRIYASTSLIRQDYSAALDSWKKIMNSSEEELIPMKAEARYHVSVCLMEMKDYAGVIQELKTLLKEFPDWNNLERVYYYLAWAYLYTHQDEEALKYFELLTKKFPESKDIREARLCVADYYYRKQSPESDQKALSLYAALVKENPVNQDAVTRQSRLKIGYILYRKKEYKQAVTYLKKIISDEKKRMESSALPVSEEKDSSQVNKSDVKTYTEDEHDDKAILSLKQREKNFLEDALYILAESFYELGEYEDAQKSFQEALSSDHLHSRLREVSLYRRAQALDKLSRYKESISLYDTYLKEFPNAKSVVDAMFHKAHALFHLKKLDEAQKICDEIQQKDTGWAAARALFLTGEIKFMQKKPDEAIIIFYQVFYGYSDSELQADALYETARCFAALGKKEQEMKHYKMLLEKFPNTDKGKIAAKKMMIKKEDSSALK